MKSVAPSDQMRASGSGRRKVALPPGRSQLDWVRNSARFPAPRPRTIPMREVREHKSRDDAWLVINGKVFDVTPYVEYHPGGVDMILAGAGRDATRLFNKYHSWVNPDFMLKRCFLGMVNASDDVERVGEDASDSESDSDTDDEERSSDLFGNNMTTNPGNRDEMDEDVDALYIAELQE